MGEQAKRASAKIWKNALVSTLEDTAGKEDEREQAQQASEKILKMKTFSLQASGQTVCVCVC